MLKILKQEFLFIPLMLLIVEGVRAFLSVFYPETAMFDRGSELETFLFRVWQMVWITSSVWIIMAVAFPAAYRSLKSFYLGFHRMDEVLQRNFSFKIFLLLFFGLVFLLSGKANESSIRKNLCDTLHSQLHVRELTGNNDGAEVEAYLKFVGFNKGAAYCAAFVSYNLNAVGVTSPPNPKSAWSPNFAKEPYIVYSAKLNKQHKLHYKVQGGDCFTLFYPKLNRVGHVGFIVGESGGYYLTIEGNTAPNGTREGSGVHKLKRDKSKIYTVTNYITFFANEKSYHSIPITVHGKLVLSENDRKHREANRQYNSTCVKNGLGGVSRYYIPIQSGLCNVTSNGRFYCEFIENGVGKLKNPVNAIDNQRKSGSRLYLQGIRGESSMAGKENKRAYKPCEPPNTRQECYSYQRGEIHPQVG